MFLQAVSTFYQCAVWLTVGKILAGESTFSFMQTASNFCQSASCLTDSKTVWVTRRVVLLKRHFKIMKAFNVSTGCYGWQDLYFWKRRVVELYNYCRKINSNNFRHYFIFCKQVLVDSLLSRIQTGFNAGRAAYNSVFMKLWLDVKHSTKNHYFAFVVNWGWRFSITTTS